MLTKHRVTKINGLCSKATITLILLYLMINGKETINKVFAGVGSPIKAEVCRVSILKLANRYADASVTKKPKKGKNSILPGLNTCSTGLFVEALNNSWNNTIPGTIPDVIISAMESNCFPNSPGTFSIRAKNPSKKSRRIPMTTNKAAVSNAPITAYITAIHPAKRFSKVMVFGMCFLKVIFFYVKIEKAASFISIFNQNNLDKVLLNKLLSSSSYFCYYCIKITNAGSTFKF